jgi:signal transduction histidine kinase
MTDPADLRAIFLFDGLDDAQLDDLSSVGEIVEFAAGQVLFHQGQPAEAWWVLLAGRLELIRRIGREEKVVAVMERPGVWAGGFRAWSEDGRYLATTRGVDAGRMFRVPATALHDWAQRTLPFGVHLIEGFFQTVRTMEAMASQRESLIALGTVAAGLAHELNNPASAAVRAVDSLQRVSDDLIDALVRMGEGAVTAEQFLTLDGFRRELRPLEAQTGALERADREDALTDWLDDHAVDDAWVIAPALADAGADPAWCERVAATITDDTLSSALHWIASTMASQALLREVKDATTRVSDLVAAVRDYSQLDRASVQLVTVTDGIESTLVMLGPKLKDGVTVARDYDAALPRIEANPGELNQVWTNLIDNAVDAMDGAGTLTITTRAEPDAIIVAVSDTGIGMPPEVQTHAFDPFFTTKPVGKGTGLGLDACRRIVEEHHKGSITIDSRPGATTLRVRLPRQAATDS